MAARAAPACSASTLPITKPPPWIMTMPGVRAPGVTAAGRYTRTGTSGSPSQPGTERSVISSVSTPGMSILMATSSSSKARRAATGSERSITGSASTSAASSGPSSQRSPVVGIYFGCMRMPASMRIDSAFMYELDSNSTASVANSCAQPSRCGKSTSWASLFLKASEPSPAP